MDRLMTPFGEIQILIDGKPIPYMALEGEKLEVLCPDVLGRYQIPVHYVPDGKRHQIACVFTSDAAFHHDYESDEFMECQAFYNEERMKMSIGVDCEIWSDNLGYRDWRYDYNAEYLEKGMAYIIEPLTKTEDYVFGIAWIDDIGWDDEFGEARWARSSQTAFGADANMCIVSGKWLMEHPDDN